MTSTSSRKGKENAASFLLTLAACLAVWAVFYPGLLSTDSLFHYRQAVAGRFSAIWHPPLLAMVSSLVFAVGGNLGTLMLLQTLAAVFGVRAFLAEALCLLFRKEGIAEYTALLVMPGLLVLLSPASPLAYYAMTLWKDTWEAILMLWIGALALRLQRLDRHSASWRQLSRLLMLSLLAMMFALIRHNAIVALPAAAVLIYVAAKDWNRRAALTAAVAVLVLAPMVGAALEKRLQRGDPLAHTASGHPYSQILVLELAGLCADSAEICSRLPYIQSHIRTQDLSLRYQAGNIGPLLWQHPPAVDPMILLKPYAPLRQEYLGAVRQFPLRIAALRLASFYHLLGIEHTILFFWSTMDKNDLGLELNRRFSGVRDRLTRITRGIGESATWRWLTGVHALWLAVAAVWFAPLAWRRRAEEGVPVLLALLALPLSYYLSFLSGTPVREFRLMYPASLMMQCLVVALATGSAWRSLRSQRGKRSGQSRASSRLESEATGSP